MPLGRRIRPSPQDGEALLEPYGVVVYSGTATPHKHPQNTGNSPGRPTFRRLQSLSTTLCRRDSEIQEHPACIWHLFFSALWRTLHPSPGPAIIKRGCTGASHPHSAQCGAGWKLSTLSKPSPLLRSAQSKSGRVLCCSADRPHYIPNGLPTTYRAGCLHFLIRKL